MPIQRCLLLLTLLSAFLVLGGRGFAADIRLFDVRDVPVDATAAGATEARDVAFAQGQALAFDLLLRRLTLKSDWPRLPPAQGQDFKRLISGFAVGTEKRSSTRYIAKVSYSFIPDRVRSILRGAGIPFSETRAKPVLALPVLKTVDGRALLFEPDNPWARIWREKSLSQGLVPLFVPDPADQAVMPDFLPGAPAWTAAEPLARQKGAASALVAEASLRRVGEKVVADIRLIELKPENAGQSMFPQNAVSATGADEMAAMAEAVTAIVDSAGESWKQATVTADSATSSLTAEVSFAGLQDWLRVKRALAEVPTVKNYRVIALAADGAALEINYVGSSDQLATGLAQADLSLTTGADGQYVLTSRAPATPNAPAPPVPPATPSPTPAVPAAPVQ